jgi:hypothetical protein
MADTPNKGFAVLTRLPSGQLGFPPAHQGAVARDGAARPRRPRLGPQRRHGGGPSVLPDGHDAGRGRGSQAGDQLETAFRYPDGYQPTGVPAASHAHGVSVRAVEPAGDGAVMTGTVRDTHALFLTAGVLCGE